MLRFMDSPLRLASCPQVAQFDMSGQDLSLSQLSVDYWGAGDMTHTQSFITPAVNTEAHRTKYASEIIKRGWHWAMSHWSKLETCMCQMRPGTFVFIAVTQQVKWFTFKNNEHGMLWTDFIWSWVYPFCEFHCWYCVGLLRQCKLFSNILWFLIKLGVPWRMRQTELCVLKIILKPH